MKIQRTQFVLIAFAVASWLGAVLELRAAASCGGGDCLETEPTAATAYLNEHGQEWTTCYEGEMCTVLKSGSGVSTCQASGACD
jgi:hypothetical protein